MAQFLVLLYKNYPALTDIVIYDDEWWWLWHKFSANANSLLVINDRRPWPDGSPMLLQNVITIATASYCNEVINHNICTLFTRGSNNIINNFMRKVGSRKNNWIRSD